MDTEIILHNRENNEVSEMFLKENGKKFGNQALMVLRLLYKGMRLTAKQTNDILGIADGGRRLRDIYANRKDCNRQVRITNGKLEGMEYYLNIPKYPTKEKTIEHWFNEFLSGQHDDKPSPSFIQPTLF